MNKKKLFIFIIAVFGFFSIELNAQFINPSAGPIFIDTEVPRVDINLPQESIDAILEDVFSNEEYEAQFIFTSSEIKDTVENVGVRLRGNTSRNAAKKSIKVSFNTFEPGRKFYGLEKMNINGEHNDPSIIRSKLSWDLCNWVGVPASRSNHVELYVNGDYLGIYINVEHIDEEFIAKRFDDKSGNLWKCLWPADLEYIGFDPNVYKFESNGRRTYDLKTNKTQDDYTALAHFINVINNWEGEELKCELERIFDVDNYIKIIALDILLSHWDGPIANMNNYYLYHNPCTDKIQFISYDLDNTFGIDWSGRDWTEISIYNWDENSWDGGSRALYNFLMSDPEYRNRFNFYMKEILEKYFNEEFLFPYLDEKLELIKEYRLNDPVAGADYGWTYDDFLESYEQSIGDHVRKGMKEYISQRNPNALDELESYNYGPIVEKIELDWKEDEVIFDITCFDDNSIQELKFHYSVDGMDWEEIVLSVDQNSKARYIHDVTLEGIMDYYIEIVDNENNSRVFPLCNAHSERLGYLESPNLVINEFMASNIDFEADEYGEYNDWIELYNASGTVLPVGKLSLSDNPDNPGKWLLPNTALSPDKYLIIWADGDPFQGDNHANFKLNKEGEVLGLYDEKENHFRPINQIDFPNAGNNNSYARKPNGTGDFEIVENPTFGFNNDLSSTKENEFSKLVLYPNPSNGTLVIDTDINLANFQISCLNKLGQEFSLETNGTRINTSKLPDGIYTLLIQNEELLHAKNFVVKN